MIRYFVGNKGHMSSFTLHEERDFLNVNKGRNKISREKEFRDKAILVTGNRFMLYGRHTINTCDFGKFYSKAELVCSLLQCYIYN